MKTIQKQHPRAKVEVWFFDEHRVGLRPILRRIWSPVGEPYSPELQPAERLWQVTDEPLVNEYFETLDELEEVLAQGCCFIQEDPQMREHIRNLTNFHWLKLDELFPAHDPRI